MDVQFNEPQYSSAKPASPKKASGLSLSSLIIKAGLAKDAAGANKVLIIVLVLALAGIAAIWAFNMPSRPAAPFESPVAPAA